MEINFVVNLLLVEKIVFSILLLVLIWFFMGYYVKDNIDEDQPDL